VAEIEVPEKTMLEEIPEKTIVIDSDEDRLLS